MTDVASGTRVWTPRRLAAPLQEVALVLGVFLLYELGRHAVRARASLAFSDAEMLLDVQKSLLLPHETTVQALFLHSEALVRAANTFYVSVHFPATIAFLGWMWVRRPGSYRWARSLLVTITMLALLLHVAFPLAPPRLLPHHGFIDTMAVYGPSAYGETTNALTNQYAAMPSLHVAWAMVVAFVLIALLQSRWRWLVLLHPFLTIVVVVATGNHFWLDVVGAGAVVVLALLLHGRRGARAPAALL